MDDLQRAVALLLLDDRPSSTGPEGHLPSKTRTKYLEVVWEAFKKQLPKARGEIHG